MLPWLLPGTSELGTFQFAILQSSLTMWSVRRAPSTINEDDQSCCRSCRVTSHRGRRHQRSQQEDNRRQSSDSVRERWGEEACSNVSSLKWCVKTAIVVLIGQPCRMPFLAEGRLQWPTTSCSRQPLSWNGPSGSYCTCDVCHVHIMSSCRDLFPAVGHSTTIGYG